MSEPVNKPQVKEGMAALTAELDRVSLPRDSFARFAGKLERRARPSGRGLWLSLALAGAAAMLLLGLWRIWQPTRVAGFEVAAATRDTRWQSETDGSLAVLRGEATLTVSELGTVVTASAGARLRRDAAGIRMVTGRATFEVQKRPQGKPMRVLVSGGVIEVLGTRFVVLQNPGEGLVSLERGAIRFTATDGRAVLLSPGQTLHWPLSPPTASPESARPPLPAAESVERPSPEPQQGHGADLPAKVAPSKNTHATSGLFAEIEAMRIRREYDLLVDRLTEELSRNVKEPMRQRLSFELCDALIRQNRAPKVACTTIAAHLRRYPADEHAATLQQFLDERRCPH